MVTSQQIKEHAQGLGFDLCGIAPALGFPELERLASWLARGLGGDMRYLQHSAETRADIRRFLPSARSVIVTGTVYYTGDPETGTDRAGAPARIARYAWGEDYHDVLAERLERLLAWLRDAAGEPFEARIFVDKHHVQERVYARYAGLGWIAKNTCLINPDVGSWIFLAGMAVSLPLEADAPVSDACGACTLCIDACPTGALTDYELDATRCISYLTIENKSSIPEERRAQIGDRLFGCDICQEVCPHNLAPRATLDPAWQPRAGRNAADAAELWGRADGELHDLVAGSAMTRASLSRLRRNLAVVLANEGGDETEGLLDRPGGGVRRAAQSAETPLVEDHIAWAKMALRTRTRNI